MSKKSVMAWRERLQSGLVRWVKRDGPVVLAYLLVTVVMTYPLAFRLGGKWMATRDVDTFVHLWNAWWFERLIRTGQPPYYTRMLFHPNGLDLRYNSFGWTHAALSWILRRFASDVSTNNITILIAVFGTAYGGYLLARSMAGHRAAAWLGGAIYSFAPYHISHSGGHPDLAHLAPIPLSLLLLSRALKEGDLRAALGGGLMVGVAAFTSLYALDFTVIAGAVFFLYLALEDGRWRERRFWMAVAIYGVVAGLLIWVRIAPMVGDLDAFSEAIEQKYQADTRQTDLLAFVVPSHFNPIFEPLVGTVADRFVMNKKWPAYLGLIPLALTVSALTWKERRAQVLTWLGIGLVFVLLALGPVLRFNGAVRESVTLPAKYVAHLPMVRGMARPDYFVFGVLLALAVCASIGLERWLAALGGRWRAKAGLVLGLSVLLLFEYWNGAYPGLSTDYLVSPFYRQLAQEEGDFALIQLRMGRDPSKYYMFYQSIHERPIVEGLSSRTLSKSYRYIDDNVMLNLWRYRTPLDCESLDREDVGEALDALAAEGFRYVIVHHIENIELSAANAPYFEGVPITYEDEALTVYTLDDLRAHPPCVPSTGAQ